MLERMQDLPAGIVGMRAIGKVSRGDYDRVFQPIVDQARKDGKHIRFVYELGEGFEGFTAGAAWEDARLGLRSMRFLDGCAVVTDRDWVREAVRMVGFMMPCPMRVFPVGTTEEAIAWLGSLPDEVSISHRLIPESGVIVVEVKEALRVQDFEALAATADAWIESHGDLNGLVIRTPRLPGWENLGSFLRHMQFIREHERHIEHVALVSDTELAGLIPRVAEHFVKAHVKTFRYDDLDGAIAWAGRHAAHEGHAGAHSGAS